MTAQDEPLALQALRHYDASGEQAMLDFITDHLDTQPPEAQANPHPLMVLRDHTCIQAAGSLYKFLWLECEPYQGATMLVDRSRNRSAALPQDLRPQAPPRLTPHFRELTPDHPPYLRTT